jgi:hypothetical protein
VSSRRWARTVGRKKHTTTTTTNDDDDDDDACREDAREESPNEG